MNREEFQFFLKPNVSFKESRDLRGHKGVGATFLAYGYTLFLAQSKKPDSQFSVALRGGRDWAEDVGGITPRPKFEAREFSSAELDSEDSGTSIEIMIGDHSNERPRDLGWIGAQNASQWLDVLRLKTPLGGVYLTTGEMSVEVEVSVIALDGTATKARTEHAEYYFPHEINGLKCKNVREIDEARRKIKGDAKVQFQKLSSEYKQLECLWEIWSANELIDDDGDFQEQFGDEEKTLIERHDVSAYVAFMSSAKFWNQFNDDILKLRKGRRIVHGGLQLASDNMVQGDLSVIPLTSAIGYQNNSHIVVHFSNGSPDLGRKAFQPELKSAAEKIAIRIVTIMRRYLSHLRPDTGSLVTTTGKELFDWKNNQIRHRDRSPLDRSFEGRSLPIKSVPQQEQDVIALFHELLGLGVLRGLNILATSQHERYDSLFLCNYTGESDDWRYDSQRNPLGIASDFPIPYESEPKVLEYKFDLVSLIDDFSKEVKFIDQIDFVVAWETGDRYKERFFLQSLLVGDEGSTRHIFGSTHAAYILGEPSRKFEVLLLKDLLSFLADGAAEAAHQRTRYSD